MGLAAVLSLLYALYCAVFAVVPAAAWREPVLACAQLLPAQLLLGSFALSKAAVLAVGLCTRWELAGLFARVAVAEAVALWLLFFLADSPRCLFESRPEQALARLVAARDPLLALALELLGLLLLGRVGTVALARLARLPRAKAPVAPPRAEA